MGDIKYNKIKAVLAEKDRTSKWLYEKLGVSKGTVSRWVRNGRQPSVEVLHDIAKVLDVDIKDLILSTKEVFEQSETD